MLELKLHRAAKQPTYTIGHLSLGKQYLMDTIEDRDRGLRQDMPLADIKRIKVPKQTAIPAGRYRITLKQRSPSFSQKAYYRAFCNGYLPRLLSVPGYEGILIHRGVDENSSAGCIIVGENKVKGKVINSQKCFERLYDLLHAASVRGEEIWITID